MIDEVLDARDKRQRRESFWRGIIIHHTDVGGRKEIDESTWSKLSRNLTNYLSLNDNNYVSAHYTVWRDGRISQLVNPDTHEAFHSGKSSIYDNDYQTTISDLNRYCIGIELIGDGNLHEYSNSQYSSLIKLVRHLKEKYVSINPTLITGHEMVSPGRKVDPGKKFDWARFYKGVWT